MIKCHFMYLKGDVLFHVAEELWLLCCSEVTLSTFELLTYSVKYAVASIEIKK